MRNFKKIISSFILLTALVASGSSARAAEPCGFMLRHVSDQNLSEFTSMVEDLKNGYEQLSDVDWNDVVTIFGSAEVQSSDAETAARLLAENDYVVFSGGGPGTMLSANKGAKSGESAMNSARPHSFGLTITLPHESSGNAYLDRQINFQHFPIRKHFLHKAKGGFIIAIGGFGTMDEFFGLMTLIQTHKLEGNPPVVLMGGPHYDGLIQWIRTTLVNDHVIGPHDPDLFYVARTPEEAVRYIVDHRKKHSRPGAR